MENYEKLEYIECKEQLIIGPNKGMQGGLI